MERFRKDVARFLDGGRHSVRGNHARRPSELAASLEKLVRQYAMKRQQEIDGTTTTSDRALRPYATAVVEILLSHHPLQQHRISVAKVLIHSFGAMLTLRSSTMEALAISLSTSSFSSYRHFVEAGGLQTDVDGRSHAQEKEVSGLKGNEAKDQFFCVQPTIDRHLCAAIDLLTRDDDAISTALSDLMSSFAPVEKGSGISGRCGSLLPLSACIRRGMYRSALRIAAMTHKEAAGISMGRSNATAPHHIVYRWMDVRTRCGCIDEKECAICIAEWQKGLLPVLKQFSSSKIHLLSASNNGFTAIHMCAAQGLCRPLKDMLSLLPPSAVYATTQEGKTPLHAAASAGRLCCADMLIDQYKAPLICRDIEGKTPAHCAASNGHWSVAELLEQCEPTVLHIADKSGRLLSQQRVTIDAKSTISPSPKSSHMSIATETFNLQVCSDLHIEFGYDTADVLSPQSPYLALLGDIGVVHREAEYEQFLMNMADLYEIVFVLAGNHEYYGSEYGEANEKMRVICGKRDNLIWMNRQRYELQGVILLGCTLWSHAKTAEEQKAVENYLNDYRKIRINCSGEDAMRVDEGDGSDGKRSITAQDTNRWPERDVAWLQHELKEVEKANQLDHEDRKVVVLTHHSPLFPGSGNPKYWYQPSNAGFASDLSLLFDYRCLKSWVYGHTHHMQDMVLTSCMIRGENEHRNIAEYGIRFLSNPHGYTMEGLCFDPKLVLRLDNE